MLEQFFEYEENREVFKDYKLRQEWVEDQLVGFKFVWAVAEEVSVSQTISYYLFSLFLRARKVV